MIRVTLLQQCVVGANRRGKRAQESVEIKTRNPKQPAAEKRAKEAAAEQSVKWLKKKRRENFVRTRDADLQMARQKFQVALSQVERESRLRHVG